LGCCALSIKAGHWHRDPAGLRNVLIPAIALLVGWSGNVPERIIQAAFMKVGLGRVTRLERNEWKGIA
jgi:hypothetical protein